MKKHPIILVLLLITAVLFPNYNAIADDTQEYRAIEQVVHTTLRSLMHENDIPGMAVAIIVQGKQYFFNYGVASQASGQKVTEDTLFEIGSISKVFTTTLACYAQENSALSLNARVSDYMPEFTAHPIGKVTLLELGTYTAGGLPLQFPEAVRDLTARLSYYKNWKPTYAAGTYRLYANPSIGLLGYLAAKSMGDSFDSSMDTRIFPKLGLSRTYIRVPQEQMGHYAYGYSKANEPVRVTLGAFDAEAYGVKTNAADLLHFVAVQMNSAGLEGTLQRAIAATQTGYYKVGTMVQGLGWEMYPYPIGLDSLLAGNSAAMVVEANKIHRLSPPQAQQGTVLLNKTGSTNGFGAYVAFVPAKKMGIVLLANKNYPNSARITAAHHILTALDTIATANAPH